MVDLLDCRHSIALGITAVCLVYDHESYQCKTETPIQKNYLHYTPKRQTHWPSILRRRVRLQHHFQIEKKNQLLPDKNREIASPSISALLLPSDPVNSGELLAMGPIVLTQLGLSMLAGAVLVKSVLDQKPMAGPFQRCSTCNGTGRVACLCSRWSDGDVGCRTCSGSGRMACSSCGGTGTGRPIQVQLSVKRPNRPA
ncbi:hypothetical protein SAY86_003174 [Trapa natans]|uniref:Uncharacterized protein n=1 Tax=Trapa natans TaxID=22666 RepID=A0AAN7R362_TRANT|nr:hypothetical protein SAY86_003174 [Trapa natans]